MLIGHLLFYYSIIRSHGNRASGHMMTYTRNMWHVAQAPRGRTRDYIYIYTHIFYVTLFYGGCTYQPYINYYPYIICIIYLHVICMFQPTQILSTKYYPKHMYLSSQISKVFNLLSKIEIFLNHTEIVVVLLKA